eukprot:364591-Chlamydomonas_euryale.AAC.3
MSTCTLYLLSAWALPQQFSIDFECQAPPLSSGERSKLDLKVRQPEVWEAQGPVKCGKCGAARSFACVKWGGGKGAATTSTAYNRRGQRGGEGPTVSITCVTRNGTVSQPRHCLWHVSVGTGATTSIACGKLECDHEPLVKMSTATFRCQPPRLDVNRHV